MTYLILVQPNQELFIQDADPWGLTLKSLNSLNFFGSQMVENFISA